MRGTSMTLKHEAEAEAELEMAARHVREGEEHVTRQREIVDQLPASGEVADMARMLLAEYEETLDLHRLHLARLPDAS